MTNTPLDIEAAKAAEELQAAKDKARAAEAKAQLAEQQRKEQAEADRAKFEEQRRADFEQNYLAPIKQLRKDFTEAVANGGNTLKAWTDYMEAVHKATHEESRFANYFHDRQLSRYEHIAKQVNEWNQELQHYANTDYVRAPYDPGTEPRGPWTVAVESIAAKTKRQTGKPANRIQQINNELNALSTALGKPLRRELDSTQHILVTDLIDKPSPVMLIHVDRYEKRTYTQALQQAIDQRMQQAAQEHRAQVQQDIQAHRNRPTK